MKFGHEAIMAGYMGMNKTIDGIPSNLIRPNMYKDLIRLWKSYLSTYSAKSIKAIFEELPTVSTPFQCVFVELIGSQHPPSAYKHHGSICQQGIQVSKSSSVCRN